MIKQMVVWVNGWFDPPKETEAATSPINGGADVLFQNTDSPAVLKTAEAKAKVEEVKRGLADGSFAIWKGPVTDNTGKVQVAKDRVTDNKFLCGLNFYVTGVGAKVPGAK